MKLQKNELLPHKKIDYCYEYKQLYDTKNIKNTKNELLPHKKIDYCYEYKQLYDTKNIKNTKNELLPHKKVRFEQKKSIVTKEHIDPVKQTTNLEVKHMKTIVIQNNDDDELLCELNDADFNIKNQYIEKIEKENNYLSDDDEGYVIGEKSNKSENRGFM